MRVNSPYTNQVPLDIPHHKTTDITISGTCFFGINNRYTLVARLGSKVILEKKLNWFQWEHAVCHTTLINEFIDKADEAKELSQKTRVITLKQKEKDRGFKKDKAITPDTECYDQIHLDERCSLA
jgi:hypothetical protein